MVEWSCMSYNSQVLKNFQDRLLGALTPLYQPGHHELFCDAKKAYLRGSPFANKHTHAPPVTGYANKFGLVTKMIPQIKFFRRTYRVLMYGAVIIVLLEPCDPVHSYVKPIATR